MLAHLAAFDFFKSEFSLRFHKHQSISTTLGLLFSLIILVILAFYASQSDLFHRVAPRVLDSTLGLDNRPEINYQKKALRSWNSRSFGIRLHRYIHLLH